MTPINEASLHVPLHTIGVHTLLCVMFALLTAGSNACAAVLQRKAAAQVPPERSMHVSLVADLMRRKVWLAGIGMVIVAAVAQAAALATGPIALVQPIFIIELPVTLVLAALANHNRAALRRLPWMAIAVTTGALGAGPGIVGAGGRGVLAGVGQMVDDAALRFVLDGRGSAGRAAALLGEAVHKLQHGGGVARHLVRDPLG